MSILRKVLGLATAAGLAGAVLSLSGCSDPQVYGSVGVSSGYGGYYGGGYYGGGDGNQGNPVYQISYHLYGKP